MRIAPPAGGGWSLQVAPTCSHSWSSTTQQKLHQVSEVDWIQVIKMMKSMMLCGNAAADADLHHEHQTMELHRPAVDRLNKHETC